MPLFFRILTTVVNFVTPVTNCKDTTDKSEPQSVRLIYKRILKIQESKRSESQGISNNEKIRILTDIENPFYPLKPTGIRDGIRFRKMSINHCPGAFLD